MMAITKVQIKNFKNNYFPLLKFGGDLKSGVPPSGMERGDNTMSFNTEECNLYKLYSGSHS